MTRARNAARWILLAIWAGLMTFAGISVVNPRWLQELSRSGAGVEARTAKEFGDNLLHDGNVRYAISQYHLALQFQPDYTEAMCNL